MTTVERERNAQIYDAWPNEEDRSSYHFTRWAVLVHYEMGRLPDRFHLSCPCLPLLLVALFFSTGTICLYIHVYIFFAGKVPQRVPRPNHPLNMEKVQDLLIKLLNVGDVTSRTNVDLDT